MTKILLNNLILYIRYLLSTYSYESLFDAFKFRLAADTSTMKLTIPPSPPPLYIAATSMSLIGWSLAWIVDKSCAFVVIIGRDVSSGSSVDSISRGTQEGQYRPGDTCRPWRRYQNEGVLELDSNMIATRVSAALSIVLGAIVIGGLIVAYLKEWRRVRRSSNQDEVPSAVAEDSPPPTSNNTPQKPNIWLRILACLSSLAIIATFQGLTHLMISSELCAGTSFQTIDESTGDEIIWGECVVDTAAYRITFPSIVIWAITALLVLRLPVLDLS